MKGIVSEEMEMKAAASEAWKLLGTLKLGDMERQALPGQITKFDIKGDGSQGTIIETYFTPGGPMAWAKEELIVVDDEKMVKVAKLTEGGFLDMGFTSFEYRWEVSPTAHNQCIAKASIEYEAKDEEASIPLVSGEPLLAILQTAANYLVQHHNQ